MTQVPTKGAISIKTEPKIRDIETLTPKETPYDPGDGTKKKIKKYKTKKDKITTKNRGRKPQGEYSRKFSTKCKKKNKKIICK